MNVFWKKEIKSHLNLVIVLFQAITYFIACRLQCKAINAFIASWWKNWLFVPSDQLEGSHLNIHVGVKLVVSTVLEIRVIKPLLLRASMLGAVNQQFYLRTLVNWQLVILTTGLFLVVAMNTDHCKFLVTDFSDFQLHCMVELPIKMICNSQKIWWRVWDWLKLINFFKWNVQVFL